ncbi:MAG: TonB-dependent receptor [Paludibacteraceae bacterium]|nr:TonB-dependent receptor [Paludibacteraceae bacterium]
MSILKKGSAFSVLFLGAMNLFAQGTLVSRQIHEDSINASSQSLDKDSVITEMLGPVVVTGTMRQVALRSVPMSYTLLDRDHLTAGEHQNILPTLMTEVPGLMVTSRGMMGYGVSTGGSGGMMLRGISSANGQLLVLVDGHPQYQGIYGHSISDSYQTMMTDRVEVLRGPASLLYGSNAMGGVVNIISRDMKRDTVLTNIDLAGGSFGTVQAEASNQVKKGKFSSTVAAQFGRSDNHRPNMGIYQYGGYAKLNYQFSEHWKSYVNADVTHFSASNPGPESAPLLEADQWITRGVVAVGVDNHYKKTSGSISLYDNFGRHKINDGYAADGGSPQKRLFRSKDALAGFTATQSIRPFRGNCLTFGFDYQHIYGRAYYTNRETGAVMETPNKQSAHVHNNEVAGYLNFHQDLVHWCSLDAGVRYDHHSVVGGEWIPQAGLVFRPLPTGSLKLMASKGFRNPTTREMYLYPPSNTDLQPERLWNYEISWRHAPKKVDYGVNVFYIKGDNIIQTVEKRNVNTGEIENWGAEADIACNINEHWRLTTNHSYLHMRFPVVAAPTYKGYLGAVFQMKGWSAQVGLQQVAGLYTAVGQQEVKENFTLLNAMLSYRFNPYVKLWLRVDNLLNQTYEINAGYPLPGINCMGGFSLSF